MRSIHAFIFNFRIFHLSIFQIDLNQWNRSNRSSIVRIQIKYCHGNSGENLPHCYSQMLAFLLIGHHALLQLPYSLQLMKFQDYKIMSLQRETVSLNQLPTLPVDIEIPKVEVRFEKLCVEGDAFNGSRAPMLDYFLCLI
ncbi:hypothetical protein TSUD_204600 [Trifolium subterraneum]|uniref:Uncharacterized protein n=1 Tax=Trifolium subterraneum TaxID=3900 RepID=A0A2Z6M9Y4_TRISU|nr:hypothetical protein TSUD_204600 [Trifolium subterraneum]